MIATVKTDVKQQEINKSGNCTLHLFTGVPSLKT